MDNIWFFFRVVLCRWCFLLANFNVHVRLASLNSYRCECNLSCMIYKSQTLYAGIAHMSAKKGGRLGPINLNPMWHIHRREASSFSLYFITMSRTICVYLVFTNFIITHQQMFMVLGISFSIISEISFFLCKMKTPLWLPLQYCITLLLK